MQNIALVSRIATFCKQIMTGKGAASCHRGEEHLPSSSATSFGGWAQTTITVFAPTDTKTRDLEHQIPGFYRRSRLLPDEVLNVLEEYLLALVLSHELHGHVLESDIAGVLHRKSPSRLDTMSRRLRITVVAAEEE